MKNILHHSSSIVMGCLAILANHASGQYLSLQEKAARLPEPARQYAVLAADALEARAEGHLQSALNAAVTNEASEAAILILKQPSDRAMRLAAKALANTIKERKGNAQALVDRLVVVPPEPSDGGTETWFYRKESLQAMESALCRILLLDVIPALKTQIPLEVFREAIAALPDDKQPPSETGPSKGDSIAVSPPLPPPVQKSPKVLKPPQQVAASRDNRCRTRGLALVMAQ